MRTWGRTTITLPSFCENSHPSIRWSLLLHLTADSLPFVLVTKQKKRIVFAVWFVLLLSKALVFLHKMSEVCCLRNFVNMLPCCKWLPFVARMKPQTQLSNAGKTLPECLCVHLLYNWAMTQGFQRCGILTSVDSF